jgi:hypothetical protein
MFQETSILKVGALILRQAAKVHLDFDQILGFITFAMAFAVCLPLGSPVQTPSGTFSLGLNQRGSACATINNLGLLADGKATTRAWVYRRIGPKVVERKIRTKPTGKDVRTGELTGPSVP